MKRDLYIAAVTRNHSNCKPIRNIVKLMRIRVTRVKNNDSITFDRTWLNGVFIFCTARTHFLSLYWPMNLKLQVTVRMLITRFYIMTSVFLYILASHLELIVTVTNAHVLNIYTSFILANYMSTKCLKCLTCLLYVDVR